MFCYMRTISFCSLLSVWGDDFQKKDSKNSLNFHRFLNENATAYTFESSRNVQGFGLIQAVFFTFLIQKKN